MGLENGVWNGRPAEAGRDSGARLSRMQGRFPRAKFIAAISGIRLSGGSTLPPATPHGR